MRERHSVYLRRFVERRPPPWTADRILQQYRFCNIYRELDRVTIWIREHIREPYAEHPNLWFMLCAARQINWPETLAELMARGAWPTGAKWSAARARRVMLARQARGDKLYTGAYMLNAHGVSPDAPKDKAYFTCYLVLGSVWRARKKILAALAQGTLQAAHAALLPYHGWGDFTAAQVVADLKYTRYLTNAPDWWDWAVLGPGSKRGLNRVLGRPITGNFPHAEEVLRLLRSIRDHFKELYPELPPLCLQDVQNCLCEFDKYCRAKFGEGRPRARYSGDALVF